MNYEITDLYHQLIILLDSQLQNTGDIYLQTFVNGSSAPYRSYVVENNSNPLKFIIKHSDYSVGDVITDVKVVLTKNSGIPLYSLNEGITILVDGVEAKVEQVTNGAVVLDEDDNPLLVDEVTSPQFAIKLPNNDAHTIQAVYKGNEEIGVKFSDKLTIVPEQRQESGSGGELIGNYVLKIIKMPKTMKYMSEVDWQFQLTKGGELISGKTLEKITPRNIWSDTDYNKDGIYYVKTPSLDKLKQWNVGKYKCGARFYHYDDPNTDKSIVCQVFQDITITKATPRLEWKQVPNGTKGYVYFYLRYPKLSGFTDSQLGIEGAKLKIKVGGKTYNKTTNSSGAVKIARNTKKYTSFKVSYAGNKNLNKISKTFS